MTYGSCHSRWLSNVHTYSNPCTSASSASCTVRQAGGLVWRTTPNFMFSASASLRRSPRSDPLASSSTRDARPMARCARGRTALAPPPSSGARAGDGQARAPWPGCSCEIVGQVTAQEPAVGLRPHVARPVHEDRAAGHHPVDVTVDLEALPGRVVHVHVVALPEADGGVALRVVDHQVGVRARLYDALAPVEAEHARRRGRDQLDPARQGDLAGHDALVEQVDPVLDGADAVGDGPEVAGAQVLLALHAEGAVVGGDRLQVVRPQGPPHGVLVALGPRAQRRRADPLGPLEVAPLLAP